MINVIKTCSCFIDKSVWFINLPENQSRKLWLFNDVKTQSDVQDILDNKFIKEIRSKRVAGFLQNTIVISCVDCFYFQLLLLSFENNSIFDTIN